MDRVHVAAFPSTGSGHINPMLELARRLVPLGFTVSFLLTENDWAKMNSQEEHIRYLSIPNPQGALLFCPELQEPVESILNAASSHSPVKCIISDFFLGWSQDLADKMGIPRIAFATCSAIAELLCYSVPLLDSKGYIPVDGHLEEDSFITFLPGVENLRPRQLPMAFRADNPFIRPLGKALQRMKEALCVLANTVEELEQEIVISRRSEFSHYLPVGPLIPSAVATIEQNSCINWLDKQAPSSVLYIAFGSGHTLPADKVEKIAKAVKASGQPFLWAIRRNFAKDTPEFYDSVATRFGEQGMVVEWAPQTQVLQHPSVAAFFSHCGWNSTIETVCSGTPTICWPCGAEQNVNAFTMVEKWKIGLKVAEGDDAEVTEEAIERIIRRMMEGGEGAEMRSRAGKLRDIARGAHEAGGCSQKNLQSLKDIIVSATGSG